MQRIDGSLRYFGALCDQISGDSSLTVKQEILAGFVARYSGDLGLLFKLLLPKYNGRLYHMQDKQLIKLFALALNRTEKTIKDDVNITGCIATTVSKLFVPKGNVDPVTGWCALTLEDLDAHLDALSKVTQEDAQLAVLQKFLNVACKKAVFVFLREVKQDLKLGANIRILLAGLHPSANNIYRQCANIQEVVRRVQAGDTAGVAEDDVGDDPSRPRSPSPGGGNLKKGLVAATITVGMPLSPMLAAPAKNVDQVLLKCPNGAFSETKYDGERIQIHKNGPIFTFFARSLKPMKADKYEGLESYLTKAIQATSCILDGEILLVDIETSQPLPFGTLGKHKKAQFLTACTCIVLFDMMYLNGVPLLTTPLDARREQMKGAVHFIQNRVVFSEMRVVSGTPEQRTFLLKKHLGHAIAEGLEGLVIKDVKSVYEPGARHWVKLKKDYIDGMADSADLVVLGAYYGSGNKGGLLSTFLMGVCDKHVPVGCAGRWKTVCKVGNGHDDATIASLNARYKTTMRPPATGANGKAPMAPSWIDIHNAHMPDMFAIDPESSDVWEIIGAEFSTTKTHTAAAISFRFPRVLKRRDDKDANTATSLQELVKLVEASKEKSTRLGLAADLPNDDDDIGNGETGMAAQTTRAPQLPIPVVGPAAVPMVPATGVTMSAASAEAVSARASTRFSNPHEHDDDYAARMAPSLCATVPLDDEGCQASNEVSAAAAHGTATGGRPIPGSVEYVVSEIAQPLSTAANPHQNMVILHSTAHKGKWSNRGTMGSITKYLGEEPEEAYNELSPSVNIGEIIFCAVSNRLSSGKLFVGTMIGQMATTRAGEVPQVDHAALTQCIRKGFAFATKHAASLHVAKMDKITGVDWGAVNALLKSLAMDTGTRVVVYSRDGGALTRTKTYAAPPTIEARGFTHIKPSSPSLPTSSVDRSPGLSSSAATTSSLPAASIPMSRTDSDLGSGPFLGGVVCCITPSLGLRDAATLQQKLTMTGGQTTKNVDEATHFIATGSDDPSLSVCNGTRCQDNIVRRAWVDESFVHGKRLPEDAYRVAPSASLQHAVRPPSNAAAPATLTTLAPSGGSMVFHTMRGARIVLEGFGEGKEKDELATKICMMGGVVQDRWRTTGAEKSTHMVAKSYTAEAHRASDLGALVLKRAWVDTALQLGVCPSLTPSVQWSGDVSGGSGAPQRASAPPPMAPLNAVVVRRAAQTRADSPSAHPPSVHPQTAVTGAGAVRPLPQTLREDSTSMTGVAAPPCPAATAASSPAKELSPGRGPTIDNLAQRIREPTPPRVHLLDALPATAQHVPGLLHGKAFAVEGYAADITQRILKLLKELDATILPRYTHGACDYLICEVLTPITTAALCVSGRVLTSTWLGELIRVGHWVNPEDDALRYVYGSWRRENRALAVSPAAVRSRREREDDDTEDDDVSEQGMRTPPRKLLRPEVHEGRRAMVPGGPAASLPPTMLQPPISSDDDDRTETASTVSDDVKSPHRGALSPASTEIEEEAANDGKRPSSAVVVGEATRHLLPSQLDGLLAVMVPLHPQHRDADVSMALNEARRYVIAYGGEVATCLEDVQRIVASPTGSSCAPVVLLCPPPELVPADAEGIARRELAAAGVSAVAGRIDKAWVIESLQLGRYAPYSHRMRRTLHRLAECVLSIENHVALIDLNRPARKNALGKVLLNELQQAVRSCHKNQAVRCVVMTSSVDGVFCAGADLKERKEMTPDEARAFVDQLRQTFCDVEDLSVPCIAVVEGQALGGGLELALAADLRISGAKALFGVPETALGIIPGAGGTQRLTKVVGLPRAKRMAFSAKPVTAATALQYGLVDEVAEFGQARAAALKLAADITANGPIAVAAAKQSMNMGFYATSRDAGMAIERASYELVLASKDRLEGLKAFAEKRKPQYRGE